MAKKAQDLEVFDISPKISSRLGVWPGDQNFERKVALDFKQGDNLVLSAITTTLHLGAHTDAPNHYHPDGEDIASQGLKTYMGNCQVIAPNIQPGERIKPEHMKGIDFRASRVLFKTNSFPDPENWSSNFCSLSPELINLMHSQDVNLVGIDTPSVDPQDDKKLLAHTAVYKNDMAILEGVDLKNVSPGLYKLIALPLAIESGDASPVRAILFRGDLT